MSGIHKSAATSAVAALLDETLSEAKRAEVVEPEHVVEEEEATSVAQASLPPLPMSSSTRIVGVAFAVGVAAIAVGIGLFVTRPAAPAAPAKALSMHVMQAPSTPVASVPEVSIPAATDVAVAPPTAPIESAQPATKPPATLADAEWMLRHGQAPRAEAIYRSILASGGSEHEALTGLGKVAIYNHQPTEALAFFERALARQPHYFPARLGRADALWDAGRRDSAKAQYAAIREGHPDNTIPARIIERTR